MEYQIIQNIVCFRGFGKPNAPLFLQGQLKKEFTPSRVYQQDKGLNDSGVNKDFRNSMQVGVSSNDGYIRAAARAIQDVNEQYFKMNISSYCIENSLVRYEPGGFFSPHNDMMWPPSPKNHDESPVRKLTAIMLISDPSEFTGGHLKIWNDNIPFRTNFNQGDLLIFPSYVRHVVEEVKSGVRYSLVMWSHGLL